MRRPAVLLLVALLAPILAVTSGQGAPAAAASSAVAATGSTTYGEAKNLDYAWDSGLPGNHGACSMPGYWSFDGGTLRIHIDSGRCKVGWRASTSKVRVMASGTDAEGRSCIADLRFDRSVPLMSGTDFDVDMVAPASSLTCHIRQGCVKVARSSLEIWNGGYVDKWETEECSAWDLGTPQIDRSPDACEYGTPSRPTFSTAPNGSDASGNQWRQRKASFRVDSRTGGVSGRWWTYVVVGKKGTPWTYRIGVGLSSIPGGEGSYFPGIGLAGGWITSSQDGAGQWRWTGDVVYAVGDKDRPDVPPETYTVVGVGMVRVAGDSDVVEQYINYSPTAWPDFPGRGMVGVSDPGRCAFYWGQKFYDDTRTGRDDPMGPLAPGGSGSKPTPAPAVPDMGENCPGFSLKDPSSWAGAAMCQLVDLMGSLLDALIGIPLAIIEGLSRLLWELLIPDPSSWGLDGLRDQVTERPPGSIAFGLMDRVGSVGHELRNMEGCGTFADFTPPGVKAGAGGLDCRDIRDAGGGALSALRTLVAAGMVMMTALALLRMFAGLFGAKD